MKIVGYSDYKYMTKKASDKMRPKTAQTYSYNRMIQILEGKYASLNTIKVLEKPIENLCTEKKKPVLNNSSKSRKTSKNIPKNQDSQYNPLFDLKRSQDHHHKNYRHHVTNTSKQNHASTAKKEKKWEGERKQKFVRYADQNDGFLKTQQVLIWQMPKTLKSQKLIRKTKRDSSKRIVDSKEDESMMEKSILTSWKSDEQLGISSLMKKNWQF